MANIINFPVIAAHLRTAIPESPVFTNSLDAARYNQKKEAYEIKLRELELIVIELEEIANRASVPPVFRYAFEPAAPMVAPMQASTNAPLAPRPMNLNDAVSQVYGTTSINTQMTNVMPANVPANVPGIPANAVDTSLATGVRVREEYTKVTSDPMEDIIITAIKHPINDFGLKRELKHSFVKFMQQYRDANLTPLNKLFYDVYPDLMDR